jgi:hypothetical protein
MLACSWWILGHNQHIDCPKSRCADACRTAVTESRQAFGLQYCRALNVLKRAVQLPQISGRENADQESFFWTCSAKEGHYRCRRALDLPVDTVTGPNIRIAADHSRGRSSTTQSTRGHDFCNHKSIHLISAKENRQ